MKQIDWQDLMFKIIILAVALACVCGGCAYVNRYLGLGDDHAVEEYIEDHIQDHTGLDIDLSPGSPEQR